MAAVLEGELSTLGAPIADCAYRRMSWPLTPDLFRGLAGADLAAAAIPDEADYLARYLRRTGRPRPQCWEFCLVLAMFRIASIMQGMARRSLDGTASNSDAAEVGAKAGPISEIAVERARAWERWG